MTPDDDDDELPSDAIAIAASLRRLREIASQHPELLGPSDLENVSEWTEILGTEEGSTMAKDKEATVQVAFRLPESLVERIDRHVERMNGANPGLDFSRADAVRSLLTRSLDEIEGVKRKGAR